MTKYDGYLRSCVKCEKYTTCDIPNNYEICGRLIKCEPDYCANYNIFDISCERKRRCHKFKKVK